VGWLVGGRGVGGRLKLRTASKDVAEKTQQ
jgi:hypothetical protein